MALIEESDSKLREFGNLSQKEIEIQKLDLLKEEEEREREMQREREREEREMQREKTES